jgi:hypothetical protein
MKVTRSTVQKGLIAAITIVSVFILTAMIAEIQQPEKDLSLARVQKMSGKYVFLSCEPLNDYDVAFEIKGFTLGHFDTPDEMANFVVKNALKISSKEHKEFDGVVVGSGKVDIAIKFK